MQTLYPIIRRVRRSLVVTEAVADGPPKPQVVVGNVEPAPAVATEAKKEAVVEVEPVRSGDEKVTTKSDRP